MITMKPLELLLMVSSLFLLCKVILTMTFLSFNLFHFVCVFFFQSSALLVFYILKAFLRHFMSIVFLSTGDILT